MASNKAMADKCIVAMYEQANMKASAHLSGPVLQRRSFGNIEAVLSMPVARNLVSQEKMPICGAAATAGALNACREGVNGVRRFGWRDILYKHFRDRQRRKVVKGKGRPTTKYVGNRNILRVIRSIPKMRAEVLLKKGLAKNPAKAWRAVTAALRKPRSVVLFHTKNHYVLVPGYVGSEDYKDKLCSLLYARRGQQPKTQQPPIPFSEACGIIARSKGMYRMFRFYYDSS